MSDDPFSFAFRPIGEHCEYKRLKWWHIRKTKVRVITDVRLYEWGISPDSLFHIAPPKESE